MRRAATTAMVALLVGWALIVAEPAPAQADTSIVTVDSSGAVGLSSSLALDAAGNPVVSYYDQGNRSLKLAHCNDPACAGGDESVVTVDADMGAGSLSSLALDAVGNPVISYYRVSVTAEYPSALRLVHCNDPACAGGDESIIEVDRGRPIGGTSLALDAAGNPVISFSDVSRRDLLLVHCNDPACAGGDGGIVAVDTVAAVGASTWLALDAAGNPVVAYYDSAKLHLLLAHCNDPDCAGGDESLVTVDSQAAVNSGRALALDAAGNPVVAYTAVPSTFDRGLKLVHCNDPDCAGGDEGIVAVDPDPGVGYNASLALDAAGNPVVSYDDRGVNDGLLLVRCNDSHCAGSDEARVAIDTEGEVGNHSSLALDAAGNPVVSYYDDTNSDLKLAHCDTATCAPATGPPPDLSLEPATGLHDGDPMAVTLTDLEPGGSYELAMCRGAQCGEPQPAVAGPEGAVTVPVPAAQRFTSVTGGYVYCRADCEIELRGATGAPIARSGFTMAEGTVSVTPDSGLIDGQAVQVTGADLMPTYDGPMLWVFDTGDWALTQCDSALLDDISLYNAFLYCAMPTQPITVEGSTLDVAQQARGEIAPVLGGTTDCTAAPGACVIGLLRFEQDASMSVHAVPVTLSG